MLNTSFRHFLACWVILWYSMETPFSRLGNYNLNNGGKGDFIRCILERWKVDFHQVNCNHQIIQSINQMLCSSNDNPIQTYWLRSRLTSMGAENPFSIYFDFHLALYYLLYATWNKGMTSKKSQYKKEQGWLTKLFDYYINYFNGDSPHQGPEWSSTIGHVNCMGTWHNLISDNEWYHH